MHPDESEGHRAETVYRSDGEVDFSCDDDKGLSQGQNRKRAHGAHEFEYVGRREKVAVLVLEDAHQQCNGRYQPSRMQRRYRHSHRFQTAECRRGICRPSLHRFSFKLRRFLLHFRYSFRHLDLAAFPCVSQHCCRAVSLPHTTGDRSHAALQAGNVGRQGFDMAIRGDVQGIG